MQSRFLGAIAVSLFLIAAGGAGAASTPLTNYPVARGGFALAVPTAWVDLTSTTPTPNAKGKVPTMAEIAKAAFKDGSKKLVVLDPQSNGRAYIEVDVERVGPVSAREAASATVAAIRKAAGKKAIVSSSAVTLGAGKASDVHFVYSQSTGTYESDEYLLIQDQIEYSLLYVAPKASWAKYSALFAGSARSFHLLAPPKLGEVVLSNAEVGKGYKGSMIAGGNSVIGQGEATLDLCAGTYPSESLRTGRLQLRYVHKGTKLPSISNEVVTYVNGGAKEALREVRSVARSCARKPVVLRQGKLENTLSVSPIKDSRLLPGAVAVRITVHEIDGKKHTTMTGVAIYQVKNNTLSGVYAWTTGGATLAQAQRLGLHAAEQSAHNLGGLALTA